MKDYYKILRVERNATSDEIKKSYKKLAFQYHPDISSEPDAHDIFVEINEDYEILSDFEKKMIYDSLLISHTYSAEAKYHKWRDEATERARNYAETDFNRFKTSVLDNISEAYQTAKKGAEVGCATYFGLSFAGAAIFGIYKYIEYWCLLIAGEKKFEWFATLSIFMILFFGWIGYESLKKVLN